MKYLIMFALVFGYSAHATSSVSADISRDTTGGTNGDLALDLEFKNSDSLSVSAGTSHAKDPSSGQSSKTSSFSLGFTFNPSEKFSITPSYQTWGAKSDLYTRSFLLDGTVNWCDWSFGLQPELKILTWASNSATRRNRPIRTVAEGINAHIDYYGFDDFDIGLTGKSMSFGHERFDQFAYTYFITNTAFPTSSGLVKSSLDISVTYNPNKWTFTADAASSQYVVSSAPSKSYSLEVRYDITQAWTAGYQFSTSKADGSSTVNASQLEAEYNW